MEGKYGRLFTEADVRKLAARWLGDRAMGPDIMVETLDELERGDELTFPADEPLFLLRGQDVAAPGAICTVPEPTPGGEDYWTACHRAGASPAHLEAIIEAAAVMKGWQLANPERVKVPD